MKIVNIVIGLLVVLLLLALVPLATIWALNTVFPLLTIPYTWQTWLAVAFLTSLVNATVSFKTRK